MSAKTRGNYPHYPNPDVTCERCVFGSGPHAEWCEKRPRRFGNWVEFFSRDDVQKTMREAFDRESCEKRPIQITQELLDSDNENFRKPFRKFVEKAMQDRETLNLETLKEALQDWEQMKAEAPARYTVQPRPEMIEYSCRTCGHRFTGEKFNVLACPRCSR